MLKEEGKYYHVKERRKYFSFEFKVGNANKCNSRDERDLFGAPLTNTTTIHY